MPLVNISLLKGKSREHIRAIADGVHEALQEAYEIPPKDHFQLIRQFEREDFIYDPDYEAVAWTQAERARGQAWGVKTIETFHTYGTPDTSGEATGPPIPPTSQIPAPPEATVV